MANDYHAGQLLWLIYQKSVQCNMVGILNEDHTMVGRHQVKLN